METSQATNQVCTDCHGAGEMLIDRDVSNGLATYAVQRMERCEECDGEGTTFQIARTTTTHSPDICDCGECMDRCEDGFAPCFGTDHYPRLVTHVDKWIELSWGTLRLLPSDSYDASRQQLATIAALTRDGRRLAAAFYACCAIAAWVLWRGETTNEQPAALAA